LGQIAHTKKDQKAEDFEFDFEMHVNIPKPPYLIARLVVLAGWPTHSRLRGPHVLHLMQGLSGVLHESLPTLWDSVIPKLSQHLQDALEKDDFPQKQWEDLVLKFLSRTLDEIDSEEFTAALGRALGEQIPLYEHYPHEKSFLFKCLGIVMRKSSNKSFVSQHIDLILASVKHHSCVEREGCTIATGFIAASHLDEVLSKLDAIMKSEGGKRSSGFFGFIKDLKSDVDDKWRATLLMSYGYVALYAPPTLITSRMETHIIKHIMQNLNNIKDPDVKQSLLKCIELVGKSLHMGHLQTTYNLTHRGDILTHIQKLLKQEFTSHLADETRIVAFEASTALVKLDPILMDAEVYDLVNVALSTTMPIPPIGLSKYGTKDESYDDHLHHEKLTTSTFDSLESLLCEILMRNISPRGLEGIFQHLFIWSLSQQDYERERALSFSLTLFNVYLDKMTATVGVNFYNMGSLVGRLIPRCTDPNVNVRLTSIDCLQAVLKISLRHQGSSPDHQEPLIEALPKLKDKLQRGDPNSLFSVANDLANVMVKHVPADQLQSLIKQLLDGLTDPHANSSSGVCVILNSLLKSRGSQLHTEIEIILQGMLEKLVLISCQQTKTGTLKAIRNLMSHHLLTVMNCLLNYQLPWPQNIIECWRIQAEDPMLLASLIDHLLDMLSRNLPYEERQHTRNKDEVVRTATLPPLAVTCALSELMCVEEGKEVIAENFHKLLAAVLVRVASTAGVQAPLKPVNSAKSPDKPVKGGKDAAKKGSGTFFQSREPELNPSSMSVEALRRLLQSMDTSSLLEQLNEEELWSKLEDETLFPEAVGMFTRLLVESMPQYVSKLVTVVNPIMGSLYEPQRVMAAALLAELINQKCGGDLELVETLVNSLLGKLVDTCRTVRKYCIRGLGNVASVGPDQVQKYATTVLSAMMSGMDDKEDHDDDMTLEAMSGLSKILAEIDESHVRAILINIALRIRPCFEKDRTAVRAAAFTLFGNLSRFGDGPSQATFLEQIHTNMISLLLHLNDPEKEVRKACKLTLRQLGPLLGSESINSMFQKHLLEDAALHYGEFINDLSKVMTQDLSDKINFYIMGGVTFFKSHWPEIRSNAAMLIGFILGNMSSEVRTGVSKEHVCSALVLLLKDQEPEVRIKAAEAMSRLHHL